MHSTLSQDHELSYYWDMIRNANKEIKLKLISKLSLSLSEDKDNFMKNIPDTTTADFLKKFAGAWKGPETAEEIISIIKGKPLTDPSCM